MRRERRGSRYKATELLRPRIHEAKKVNENLKITCNPKSTYMLYRLFFQKVHVFHSFPSTGTGLNHEIKNN